MISKIYIGLSLIDEINFDKSTRYDESKSIITLKATSNINKYILYYDALKLYVTANNDNIIYFIITNKNEFNGIITITTAVDFSVNLDNTNIYLTRNSTDSDVIDITILANTSEKYVPVIDEDELE